EHDYGNARGDHDEKSRPRRGGVPEWIWRHHGFGRLYRNAYGARARVRCGGQCGGQRERTLFGRAQTKTADRKHPEFELVLARQTVALDNVGTGTNAMARTTFVE